MKYLNYLALFFLSFTILFTSCNPNNIDEIVDETTEVKDRIENKLITRSNPDGNGLELACVTITYPFSFETINENIIEINSEEEFFDAVEDTVDYVVDFVYPLNVIVDEEELTVADVDELGELFGSCIPEEGWGEDEFPVFIFDTSMCLSLVYPMDVTDINGDIVTLESEDQLIDLLADEEVLFFQFPLTVLENDTGETIEINTIDELFEELISCQSTNSPVDSISWGGMLGECFEIVYPVSVELMDGTIVEVNSEEELNIVFLDETVLKFAYPMTVSNVETGENIEVNSDEELLNLIFSCHFEDFMIPVQILIDGNGTCFDVNYPVSVSVNGEVFTVNNDEELNNYSYEEAFVIPPFSVTLPDGTVLEVANSVFEFFDLLSSC